MNKCKRCGRQLHAEASIAAEYGPVCAKRERQDAAAALHGVKAGTVDKAREDITDGAIVDLRRVTSAGRRVFAVLSESGTGSYLATSASCTCRAGRYGRMCHHRAATILVAA